MKNKKIKILIICLVAVVVICTSIVATVMVKNNLKMKEIEEIRAKLESEVAVEEIQLDENYTHYFEQYGMTYDGSTKVDKDYTSYRAVCFINEDNSRTLYSFASAVNYQKDGKFVPIDTRIKNTAETQRKNEGYVYSVASNDTVTLFNKVFDEKKGVLIKDKVVSFEVLAPTARAEKAFCEDRENFIGVDRDMVCYGGALSQNTQTYFYPSNLGANCEIVCKDNSTHTFSLGLSISTKGVKVGRTPGGYWILTKSNGGNQETVGVIQAPIVKDKNGNIIRSNSIEIYKKFGQKNYTIDLLLDETADLTDATVYFAFEIRKGNQPDNALYSAVPALQYAYLKNHSVIGKSEDLGIGRLMVRFETAKDFLLKADMIKSADFFVYNATPSSDMTVSAVKVLEDWCSLTGNWNDNYKTGKVVATAKADGSVIKFNLTDEFKVWCDDESGQEEHNGIQLRTDESGEKNIVLLSGDNTLFNNYMEIVFNAKTDSEK